MNEMKPKRQMTEQEALFRLSALCSSSEHCSFDVSEKMRRWELPDVVQTKIMKKLVDEKFVDDNRYCRFFINDKMKINKWGRRKIEQALYRKHICREISDPIFEEIGTRDSLDTLRKLIADKRKTVKAKNEYELNGKLIKFALGRGFEFSLVRKCLDTDGYHVEDDC
jgi:regulatory protein